MKHSAGLYIRRRGSEELWQLFLGGYTIATPSALYDSYLRYFSELHGDYEWVVLERRKYGQGNRMAMFKVGDSKRVDVMIDNEEPEWEKPRFREKDVECLSLWHMDTKNKIFRGSISNRLCPECTEKEYQWLYGGIRYGE